MTPRRSLRVRDIAHVLKELHPVFRTCHLADFPKTLANGELMLLGDVLSKHDKRIRRNTGCCDHDLC